MTASAIVDAPAARSLRAASWVVELAGFGAALVIALGVLAHLCLSPRAWILFSDGDSVLLPLMRASRVVGQPQEWALSSVLFLPERALYDATAALGLGVRASLAIDGVVNLVLLYAALRIVAALVRGGRRGPQVFGTLAAFAVFAAFTLLDSSSAWDSLELPSLLATTSYYSATLLATVVAIGLGAATLTAPRRRAVGAGVTIAAVTAGSVLTNPLFLAWVSPLVPVAVALVAMRRVPLRRGALLAAALTGGALVGFALRIPFASVIVRDPSAYADPTNALPTLAYLLRALIDRDATPAGLISVAAIDTVVVLDALLAVRAIRHRHTGASVLFATGALTPIVLITGTVLVGAPALRYLQPCWLVPLIPLVLLPVPPRVRSIAGSRVISPVAAGVLAVAGVAGLGVTAASATTPDASIRCLDAWIATSGESGAGLFQTIRGPKAYLPDPRRLIQVDSRLRAEPWLTDRADYAVRRVSFLVADAAAPPFATGSAGPAPRTVACGRYRVLDWERPVLEVMPSGPVAPPHPPSTGDDSPATG